ncbi:MAG: hypothetical protein AB7V50_00475 [Vampirovibrionia bacterium]
MFLPQYTQAEDEKKEETTEVKTEIKVENHLKLNLKIDSGVCRSRSPIMAQLTFDNLSVKPQKLCTYKFYDSLIKLDIRNSKGEKVEFQPKLIQASKITSKDWVNISSGRFYKTQFSLSKMIVDATGRRLAPGNYSIRVIYDGCSKFAPELPEVKLESNLFYLMVID